MGEIHAGKKSAYEKEVRELLDRLKCKGVILIVIDGERPGADHYEVASALKGNVIDIAKIPFFLMTLAQKFAADINGLMTNRGSKN